MTIVKEQQLDYKDRIATDPDVLDARDDSGHDSGHAPRQTRRHSSAEIAGVRSEHHLIADALQQVDGIFALKP